MTLLVRDEADVIAQNLRWHLAHGVEHAIVTDNASTDGTVEAIEPFVAEGAVTLLHEPSPDYLQDVWATRMALLARERHGADWILSNDADEFWRPPEGLRDLREVLPAPGEDAPAMLVCRRHNLVAARDALGTAPWPEMLIHRGDPGPEMVEPPDRLRDPLGAPYFCHALAPKILLRARGLSRIKRGAHEAFFDDGVAADRVPCGVEVFHVPVRSRGEFERSVRQIGRAIGGTVALPATTSWKYRRWFAMTRGSGSIWPAFREAMPSRAWLRRELEAGAMVRDTRLRDGLAALSPAAAAAPRRAEATPRPDGPAAEPLGELILIAAPGGARPRALTRLLARRGAVPPGTEDGVAHRLERVHDAILAQAQGGAAEPWAMPGPPDARALALHRETLLDALLADHAGLAPAVLDDPRLPRLLPTWRAVAAQRDLRLTVVLPVTSPLDPGPDLPPAARSTLWLRDALAAERGSRGLPRLVLRTDVGPEELARRLDAILPGDVPRLLRRDVGGWGAGSDEDALMASPAIPDALKECHEALSGLAAGAEEAALAPVFDRLADDLASALDALGPTLRGLDAARRGAGRALEVERVRGLVGVFPGAARAANGAPAGEARRANGPASADAREAARLVTRERGRARRALIEAETARHQAARATVLARLAGAAPRGRAGRLATRLAAFGTRRAAAEIAAAPEFDAAWYLERHPDVARSRLSPAAHYLLHGAREGRDPGPGFDTVSYYLAHPDVLAAGANALLHYVRRGRAEGRRIAPAGRRGG